jgi:hypothetical protein
MKIDVGIWEGEYEIIDSTMASRFHMDSGCLAQNVLCNMLHSWANAGGEVNKLWTSLKEEGKRINQSGFLW